MDVAEDNPQAPDGFNLACIFEGKDTYLMVKEKCARAIKWFNELTEQDVGREIMKFVGGDGAFLNAMLGLATCAARFACMWCLCPSDSYHLFERVWEERTLEQARKAAHSWHEPYTYAFPECTNRAVDPATELARVMTKGALDLHQQTHGGLFTFFLGPTRMAPSNCARVSGPTACKNQQSGQRAQGLQLSPTMKGLPSNLRESVGRPLVNSHDVVRIF